MNTANSTPRPIRVSAIVGLCLSLLFLNACTPSQFVVRTTTLAMDGGVESMNRETDIILARAAIPANLKLLEGFIVEDPGNATLRIYAAQALYGYAFGFVERVDRQRANRLYWRGFQHAREALRSAGIKKDISELSPDELKEATDQLGKGAVPAMFWTASLWAKWIDMNRDNPTSIAQLANAAVVMERVLDLEEDYYYGSPHIFFGVYYGARSPMFGGDYAKSQQHFDRAQEINGGKFLMGDLFYAEFLARQRLDQLAFHDKLTRIIEAPEDLFPEMALANAMAKQHAQLLLAKEDEWF